MSLLPLPGRRTKRERKRKSPRLAKCAEVRRAGELVMHLWAGAIPRYRPRNPRPEQQAAHRTLQLSAQLALSPAALYLAVQLARPTRSCARSCSIFFCVEHKAQQLGTSCFPFARAFFFTFFAYLIVIEAESDRLVPNCIRVTLLELIMSDKVQLRQ